MVPPARRSRIDLFPSANGAFNRVQEIVGCATRVRAAAQNPVEGIPAARDHLIGRGLALVTAAQDLR